MNTILDIIDMACKVVSVIVQVVHVWISAQYLNMRRNWRRADY